MNVLTRYLLRAHIGPFLFAFVTLTGVILINTLAKELANLAGKGLPLAVVFEFFVLSLPANIALTLPMAVLVAVLYTFTTLAAENEITALRASGIDLRRATLPLVVGAAVVAGGMIWFNDQVLPAANYRWRVLMTDVAQTRPLLALRERVINPIRTSDGLTPYYLEAEQIDAETGSMRGVSIYDVSNEDVGRTIEADSGRMAFNPTYTDLLLRLYDGNVREVDFNDPAAFQLVAFNEQVMRMQGVSDRLERTGESAYRTDRDMTMAMMRARIDTLRTELADARVQAETGSAPELRAFTAASEGRADTATEAGVPPPDAAEAIASPASRAAPASAPSAAGGARPDPGAALQESGAAASAADPAGTPDDNGEDQPDDGSAVETSGSSSDGAARSGTSSETGGARPDAVAASAPRPASSDPAPAEPAVGAASEAPVLDAGPAIAPPSQVTEESVREEARQYAAARAENLEYQIREFQVEIQKKFSIAIATLVFVLIGIPIALRFPSGGIGMVVAVSLTIFGIYYVGLIGGETLGDEGYVSPLISMWLTNLLFGAAGLIGFLKLGAEQGTARGGGWGDLANVLAALRDRTSGGRGG